MTQKLLASTFATSLLWAKLAGAACSYSLSPGASAVPYLLTVSNFNVTAGSSCAWSSATTNSWIHPVGAASGNGAVNFTVDPNLSSSPRVGAITAGGKTFTVTQAGVPMAIGVAVNNTNLIWTTSVPYSWVGTNPPAPTFDGSNSAVSGNRYGPDSVSWMQTTVIGPGVISFWWKVDSDVTPPAPDPAESYDDLEFLVDGEMQDQIMGQIDWNYRSYTIPEGVHTVKWQYVKDSQYNTAYDQGWVDKVSYTTNAMALQEALNTCGVTWTTGGNTNATLWSGQTGTSHDGKSAAQSGSVFLNQESWLQTSVAGITNVSFWWKVSSQTNYDYLEFYTNNVLAKRITGEVAWQSNFFKLPATTNALKWRYVKASFIVVAQGQDCGWLDQVAFSPNNFKAFPYSLQPPAPLADGRARITVQGESGCNCQVLTSSNLVNWAPVTNFITSSGGASTILDDAAAYSSVRFYRAISP